MAEPMSDDNLAWLRQFGTAGSVRGLVAEVDRLRAENRRWDAAVEGHNRDLLAALMAENEQLRLDNTAWAIRWQDQHARAETAEEIIDHEILANAGDEWDLDEASCSIAVRYVRHLEARHRALAELAEAVRAELDTLVKTRSSDARRSANRLLAAARKAEAC